MTFPVPSAKLFTTETSAIGGKVNNKANAVVNLTITPRRKNLLKKNKEEPVQVQYRVEEDNTPKVYAADDEDQEEENPFSAFFLRIWTLPFLSLIA